MLALGFMVAIPWQSWGDSWALTSWLLTTRIGLSLLLAPSLGAWLGQRWRARTQPPPDLAFPALPSLTAVSMNALASQASRHADAIKNMACGEGSSGILR